MRKVSFGEWMARVERRGKRTLAAEWKEDNPDLNGEFHAVSVLVCKAAQNSGQARGEEIDRLTHLKNIRKFVCAASLMLAVWLGMTFMSDVPPHRYPTLGKGSVTTAAFSAPAPHLAVTVAPGKEVPVSR